MRVRVRQARYGGRPIQVHGLCIVIREPKNGGRIARGNHFAVANRERLDDRCAVVRFKRIYRAVHENEIRRRFRAATREREPRGPTGESVAVSNCFSPAACWTEVSPIHLAIANCHRMETL